MSAYFITSIGTGVGKTFTTCALLHAAKLGSKKISAYKPIISGWDDSKQTDTAQIIQASATKKPVDQVSPWRFTHTLSPHLAAPFEGKKLVLDEIVTWTKAQIDPKNMTLIEGVGGVMVPLTDTHTTLDWMRAMNLPLILVVGSYLGSISHSLTALEVIREAGLEIKALVMSESVDRVSFDDARAGLSPFIKNIPLKIFQPRVSSWREATAIHTLLLKL